MHHGPCWALWVLLPQHPVSLFSHDSLGGTSSPQLAPYLQGSLGEAFPPLFRPGLITVPVNMGLWEGDVNQEDLPGILSPANEGPECSSTPRKVPCDTPGGFCWLLNDMTMLLMTPPSPERVNLSTDPQGVAQGQYPGRRHGGGDAGQRRLRCRRRMARGL